MGTITFNSNSHSSVKHYVLLRVRDLDHSVPAAAAGRHTCVGHLLVAPHPLRAPLRCTTFHSLIPRHRTVAVRAIHHRRRRTTSASVCQLVGRVASSLAAATGRLQPRGLDGTSRGPVQQDSRHPHGCFERTTSALKTPRDPIITHKPNAPRLDRGRW